MYEGTVLIAVEVVQTLVLVAFWPSILDLGVVHYMRCDP